jgi:hypothetical protein
MAAIAAEERTVSQSISTRLRHFNFAPILKDVRARVMLIHPHPLKGRTCPRETRCCMR